MIIGKVLLTPKGEYNADKTYNILDWVRYNGSSWVCKVPNTVNVTPEEGDVWSLLASDGSSVTANVVKDGDTATITVTDKSGVTTAEITDGKDGQNGNKWYRGTEVSTDNLENISVTAVENDNYINITDGKVFHCIKVNKDKTTNWQYDLTLSGGGSGGASDYASLPDKPKVNNVTLENNKTSKDLGISWSGTHEEFESIKGTLVDGTTVIFTDDNIEDDRIYVTQEEFDELASQRKLIPGQRYSITDGVYKEASVKSHLADIVGQDLLEDDVAGAYSVKELTTYSKEEKVIGTWIDGRKIYSKTFEFTFPNNIVDKNPTPYTFTTKSSMNMDILLKGYGTTLLSSGQNWVFPMSYWTVSVETSYFMRITAGENNIQFVANRDLVNGAKVYATLEYVKNE